MQYGLMIGHVGILCADLGASADFYDVVLASLGAHRVIDLGFGIGYGTSMPDFWIYEQPREGPATGPNREVHIAFDARDADAVHAFFDAAVSAGATVLHPPRQWPEYHENYFAAFVRDPDGNNVEAVCHTVRPGSDGGSM